MSCKTCKRCQQPISSDRIRCTACRRPQDTLAGRRKGLVGSYEKHPETEARIAALTARADKGLPLFTTETP